MPWKEQRKMSLKIEFAEKASKRGANISALCRELRVSGIRCSAGVAG
jgi:hypothetical protein